MLEMNYKINCLHLILHRLPDIVFCNTYLVENTNKNSYSKVGTQSIHAIKTIFYSFRAQLELTSSSQYINTRITKRTESYTKFIPFM